MESREMKRGGTSYRVRLPDGRKVSLGWNLEEALQRYRQLMPPDPADFDATAANLWARSAKGAAARGIQFSLEIGHVRAMLDRSNGRCELTGRKFSNEKPVGSRIRMWAPSIDRKDSTQGYTPDNCRVVVAFANIALNQFGDSGLQALLEPMIRKIVREELARHFPRGKKLPGS